MADRSAISPFLGGGGWVGVKPAAPVPRTTFFLQSGKFLVAQKFIFLNLGSNI